MDILEKKLIEEQIKTEIFNRKNNRLKTVFYILFTALIFVLIQRPESIINRKASQETLDREKAKLLINILSEKDLMTKKYSFMALKVYPSMNSDLQKVQNEIEKSLQFEYQETLLAKIRELEFKIKQFDGVQRCVSDEVNKNLIISNKRMAEILLNDYKAKLSSTIKQNESPAPNQVQPHQ